LMLGSGTRDARRTELYLDGLMAADERHALELPVDAEMDPAVRYAARELRAGLTRLHPSFRFEDALAARLSEGAARLRAGLPVDDTASVAMPGTLAQFRGRSTAAEPAAEPATQSRDIWLAPAFRRLPDRSTHPSRPLIVGGVGVASAALSIGAVYVAWRHSHPASSRMGRAARAAHGRTTHSGGSRRSGVINGILGVVS
jgi:hypothetical protein